MDFHTLPEKKVMYYLLLCAIYSIFRHKKITYLRYRTKLDVSFTSNHSETFITTYKINIGIFIVSIIYYLFFLYSQNVILM